MVRDSQDRDAVQLHGRSRPGKAESLRPGLHLRTDAADPIDVDARTISRLSPWPTERILVGVQKSLGELVDVIVGAGSGLKVPLGIQWGLADQHAT
jgi:hypothetical protein